MSLGNRLKELRTDCGLTMEAVGNRIGYTHATVSRHESGDRAMDGAAIDRYSTLYGVEPWEIWISKEEAARIQTEREYVENVLEETLATI